MPRTSPSLVRVTGALAALALALVLTSGCDRAIDPAEAAPREPASVGLL